MATRYAPPQWTNQNLVLYHGTSARAARTILTPGGVRVSEGRVRTDFGQGFYTTTLLRQAYTWAESITLQSGNREEPAVVAITVTREELAALDSLWFVLGHFDADDFWSFVFHCRRPSAGPE